MLEPVHTQMGDVVIRDVRGLHRGTPNNSATPRPMGVLGYSPRWLRRPEVGIQVPRAVLDTASPRLRELVRFEPVVEKVREYTGIEGYDEKALNNTSGGSYR